MVLEVDACIVHVGEVGIDLELAVRDEFAKFGGVAVVLEDFDAVEPVLCVGSVDEYTGSVPFAYGMDGFGAVGCAGCGDEVVEGGDGAIAIFAELGVGVYSVVENLILLADRGAGPFIKVKVDHIEDAAVGSCADAEVDGELEVGEFTRGDDVAGRAAFFSAEIGGGEQTVLDDPA